MKLFFFDTETTGLIADKHGIHQLSGQIRTENKPAVDFDYRMCPPEGVLYSPDALKASNVTAEQIKSYPSSEQVFKNFIETLDTYVDRYDKTDKFFMVGYNIAAFDVQFMRMWFERHNHPYFGAYFWADTLDVRVLAIDKLKNRRHLMPNFKQSTVAKELGIQVDEDKLHDAEYDTKLLIGIYEALQFY